MPKPKAPWLQRHTDILNEWSGREPDAAIGKRTGHSERTIRYQREARGLPAYNAGRARWTRREWLMADAAGLDFHLPSCPI